MAEVIPNVTGNPTSNGRTEKASVLVAEDRMTDVQIAAEVGISKVTLERWKRDPAFQKRVEEHFAEFARRVRSRGIARVERRVDALQDRWDRMHQVIEERAEDETMQFVAGGKTGLLVRKVKGIGSKDDFREVEEYELDTGLLQEMRAHEKQAAQELGQWADRSEVSGPGGAPLSLNVTQSLDRIFGGSDNAGTGG